MPAEWTDDRFGRSGGGTEICEVIVHVDQSFVALPVKYVAAILFNTVDSVAFVKRRRRTLISGDWRRGGERHEKRDKMKDDHFRGVRAGWYGPVHVRLGNMTGIEQDALVLLYLWRICG